LIAVVLGTRPEIVKLAPVIRAFTKPFVVIHTGQHYDPNMAGAFFEAFGLAEPEHRLEIGGTSRGQQIGNAVASLDDLFGELAPDLVVAQGDTNSTMAAALAGNARSIPVVHVEAGLRSHDRAMPEEHNRVVTDHLSDLCLAPTQVSADNLRAEGIGEGRIVITGNTVVDAVNHLLPGASARAGVLAEHGVQAEGFVVSTFHRPENVDDPARLQVIVDQLARLGLPAILPIHPRTRAIATTHGVDLEPGDVRVCDPLGYVEFLSLLAECRLAVADSGGLQEEVSVLKRPMVVVRNSTERPEVLGTFSSLVQVGEAISEVGTRWLADQPFSLAELREIPSPYGDGDAGLRSVAAIEALNGRRR
jgi:UDP-N-acetylglucosamine 2-epimerase (non-hydrolysing)